MAYLRFRAVYKKKTQTFYKVFSGSSSSFLASPPSCPPRMKSVIYNPNLKPGLVDQTAIAANTTAIGFDKTAIAATALIQPFASPTLDKK